MGKVHEIIYDHATQPSSASVPAPPPVAANFMPNWPNGQALTAIGSYGSIYETYADRAGKCDISLIEPRYWYQSVINDFEQLLGVVASTYPHHKNFLVSQAFKFLQADFVGNDAAQSAREILDVTAMLDSGALYYIDGVNSYKAGDYVDSGWGINYCVNPNVAYVEVVSGQTYPEHYAETLNARLAMPWDTQRDSRSFIHGHALAESYLATFPKQDKDGTLLTYADWDYNGFNDLDAGSTVGGVWYREALVSWRDVFYGRLGYDRAVITDGSPDYEDYIDGEVPNTWPQPEWALEWDARIANDLFNVSLGFTKAASGYYISPTYSGTNFATAVEFHRAFLAPDVANVLGYGVVLAGHEVHEPTDPTGWAALQAMKAATLISPNVLYAPKVSEEVPAPYLDESVLDMGAPQGSWAGFGEIVGEVQSFALRSPDYTVPGAPGPGVFMQPTANGLVVFNLHDPVRDAPWSPQSVDVIPLPDPGTGRAWIYPDVASGANVNSAGLTTQNQNPSFNTGGYVSSVSHPYGSIELPRPGGALLKVTDAPVSSTTPVGSGWQPPNYPMVWGLTLVSNFRGNTGLGVYSADNYVDWTAQADLPLLQTPMSITGEAENKIALRDGTDNLKSRNPNIRTCHYIYPMMGDPDMASYKSVQHRVITDNGMAADWFLRSSSGSKLYPSDVPGTEVINPAVKQTEYVLDAQGRNHAQAFADRFIGMVEGIVQDTNFGGFYIDETDLGDRFPFTRENDSGSVVYQFDYTGDGSITSKDNIDLTPELNADFGADYDSGSVRYQKGILEYGHAINQTVARSYDNAGPVFMGGNAARWGEEYGGNNSAKPTLPIQSHAWYGNWDFPYIEHAGREAIGFRSTLVEGNEQVQWSPWKYPGYWAREVAIPLAMRSPDNSVARITHAWAHYGYNVRGNDPVATEQSDISQLKWEWIRHSLLCMLHFPLMPAPSWGYVYSIPRLDETIYDIGAPLSTQSLFNVDVSATARPPVATLRAYDDPANEVWWLECERGWVFFCGKKPHQVNNYAEWIPSSQGVMFTLPVMSGYQHAMIDCTDANYVNPKLGMGYGGQSPQINDGSIKTQIWIPALGCRVTRKVPI